MASKRIRDAGIDPERVLSSALQAALGENEPPKQRHPGRVLAAGAAVAAAAAVGQKRMPRLIKVPLRMGLHRLEHKLGDAVHVDDLTSRVDDLAGSVRERLAGHDGEPPDDEVDDEPIAEEDLDAEDEIDDDDQPRDDADEDEDDDEGGSDDEPDDDDGPRGEADDVEPDEDEPDEEGDETADDEPVDEQEPDDQGEEDDEDEQVAARSLRIGDGDDARRPDDDSPDLFQALLAPRPRPAVMRRAAREFDPASRPPKPGRPKSRKSNTARA